MDRYLCWVNFKFPLNVAILLFCNKMERVRKHILGTPGFSYLASLSFATIVWQECQRHIAADYSKTLNLEYNLEII